MAERVGIIKAGICATIASGVLVCCTGCGTVGNGIFGIPQPYGGVRSDIETVQAGGTPCMVLDLPFSAVADTLLLPVQLPNAPPTSDPLKGWRQLGSKARGPYQPAEAIAQDLDRYIKRQRFPCPPPSDYEVLFYEDGTGRHAVRFEVAFDGYRRSHILIYDKSNVRTKARKFLAGRYMC